MIEQEEEEDGKEEEKGIEFATTYLAHMPALVEGLVASLVCLAEAGDLPGRPADCLILLCRCLFTSLGSSVRTHASLLQKFSTFTQPKIQCHNRNPKFHDRLRNHCN